MAEETKEEQLARIRAEIDALTEQLKRDIESGKLHCGRAARKPHVGNLRAKVNLDEDYNYKHYYDISDSGKWRIKGY